MLEWFLLKICKERILSRYTKVFGRNLPTLYFWLRRKPGRCPILGVTFRFPILEAMITSNCLESYNELFRQLIFQEVFVQNFSWQSFLKPYLRLSNRPVSVNIKLLYLLAVCANSLVDSFPYKCMLCLWSLIWYKEEPCMSRVLQLTSAMLLFQTDFRKWFFWTLFLDGCFQKHSDSAILQKYQLLSNQSFKHNSAHMPSLNLTCKLSFEPRFCTFIINGSYTKKQMLVVLAILVINCCQF